MAADLEKEFSVSVQLIEGGGGIFDVAVDDVVVFSKHAEGDRFPSKGEVQARLA